MVTDLIVIVWMKKLLVTEGGGGFRCVDEEVGCMKEEVG